MWTLLKEHNDYVRMAQWWLDLARFWERRLMVDCDDGLYQKDIEHAEDCHAEAALAFERAAVVRLSMSPLWAAVARHVARVY